MTSSQKECTLAFGGTVSRDGVLFRVWAPKATSLSLIVIGKSKKFSMKDDGRKFVIDNALYWVIEYHVDGLRIDAIHGIFDFSARHILVLVFFEPSELCALSAVEPRRVENG